MVYILAIQSARMENKCSITSVLVGGRYAPCVRLIRVTNLLANHKCAILLGFWVVHLLPARDYPCSCYSTFFAQLSVMIRLVETAHACHWLISLQKRGINKETLTAQEEAFG